MAKKALTKAAKRSARLSAKSAAAGATVASIMSELEAHGVAGMRKMYISHGAPEPLFGVKLAELRRLATKLAKRHDLALELWDTGNVDARLLALLVFDPKQLSQKEVERIAKECRYFKLVDLLIVNVLTKVAFADALRPKWMASKDEYLGRAGWALMVRSVEGRHPAELAAVLDTIEARLAKAPLRMQETMNHCLAEIGIRHASLRPRAIAIGEKLRVFIDYPVAKGCISPYAPIWIEALAARSRRALLKVEQALDPERRPLRRPPAED